jgi:hypothetical protein
MMTKTSHARAQDDFKKLFSTVEQILPLNKALLADLEARMQNWGPNSLIADIFLGFVLHQILFLDSNYKFYILYCSLSSSYPSFVVYASIQSIRVFAISHLISALICSD